MLVDGCDVVVTVQTLSGEHLELSFSEDHLVKDVKAQVKAHWGVPTAEQKLMHMGTFLQDPQALCDFASDGVLPVMLVRGPAFHFDKRLSHPRIQIGSDRAVITHGGRALITHGGGGLAHARIQDEYQAAFLSDVLDADGSYSVRFMLEDDGGNSFKEMYVGVAPDRDRNWSNLKGAYSNHLGVYVDAFDNSGWHYWRSSGIRREIFHGPLCGSCGVPFAAQLGERPFGWCVDCKGGKVASKNMPKQAAFRLELDMQQCRLRFLTVEGKLVEELYLPQLREDDVRLCATLGYPKQKVSIVDE